MCVVTRDCEATLACRAELHHAATITAPPSTEQCHDYADSHRFCFRYRLPMVRDRFAGSGGGHAATRRGGAGEIGRAAWREREGQYVELSVAPGILKKKPNNTDYIRDR